MRKRIILTTPFFATSKSGADPANPTTQRPNERASLEARVCIMHVPMGWLAVSTPTWIADEVASGQHWDSDSDCGCPLPVEGAKKSFARRQFL